MRHSSLLHLLLQPLRERTSSTGEIQSGISSYRDTDKRVAIVERMSRRLFKSARKFAVNGANTCRYRDVCSYRYCFRAADAGATPKMFVKLREPATCILSDNTGDLLLFLFLPWKSARNHASRSAVRNLVPAKHRLCFYFIRFNGMYIYSDIYWEFWYVIFLWLNILLECLRYKNGLSQTKLHPIASYLLLRELHNPRMTRSEMSIKIVCHFVPNLWRSTKV